MPSEPWAGGWQNETMSSETQLPLVHEPRWLFDWRAGQLKRAEAVARFDALGSVRPESMIGRWQGLSLATNHPLDGLLERLGWYGKAFETLDRVHPLLFRTAPDRLSALDPGLMPMALALRAPRLARSRLVRLAFSAFLPLLGARGPAAVLRAVEFRGRVSAAMAYNRLPIVDHFRRIDDMRILGWMESQNWPHPFFFLLVGENAVRLDSARPTRGPSRE